MNEQQVNVSFDFDDDFIQEKQIFLDYLSNENWIKNNSENNWNINFSNITTVEDQFSIISKNITDAGKISKIKSVDYAIIAKEAIFFNKIN